MEKQLEIFKNEQQKFKKQIQLTNTFNPKDIRLVGGIDLAYWKEDEKDLGCCCIVVIDYLTKEIIEEVEYVGEVTVPYISGYLAFRELPLILETVKLLKSDVDIYMFDGNGYLHNENMGIATYSSFFLNKPKIGVAKSYFYIENATHEDVENYDNAVSYIQKDDTTLGVILRTHKDVKPIYVSCGNYIDLNTAIEITKHFVNKKSKLPITTRYADLNTHTCRNKFRKE